MAEATRAMEGYTLFIFFIKQQGGGQSQQQGSPLHPLLDRRRDGNPGRRREREQQDAGGEEAVRRFAGWQAIRSGRARSQEEERNSLDRRGAQVVFAWPKEVRQRRLEEHLGKFRDHQDPYASGLPRTKVENIVTLSR